MTTTELNNSLLQAALDGNTDRVNALIAQGADIRARDKDGRTALLCAAAAGHTDCVEALISAGADPQDADAAGRTALDLARENEHQDIVASAAGTESESMTTAPGAAPEDVSSTDAARPRIHRIERLGKVLAILGVLGFMLFPALNYAVAHVRAQVWEMMNPDVHVSDLTLGFYTTPPVGDLVAITVGRDDNALGYVAFDKDAGKAAAGPYVMEFEHGLVLAESKGGLLPDVLSRGYLDYTRIPVWVFVICLVMSGLGAALATRTRKEPSMAAKIAMAGSVLGIVSFFLPWFTVSAPKVTSLISLGDNLQAELTTADAFNISMGGLNFSRGAHPFVWLLLVAMLAAFCLAWLSWRRIGKSQILIARSLTAVGALCTLFFLYAFIAFQSAPSSSGLKGGPLALHLASWPDVSARIGIGGYMILLASLLLLACGITRVREYGQSRNNV